MNSSTASLLLLALVCGAAQASRPTSLWSEKASIAGGLVTAFDKSVFALAPYAPNAPPLVLLQTNVDIAGLAAALGEATVQGLMKRDSEREKDAPYVVVGGLQSFGGFFGALFPERVNTFLISSASGPVREIVAGALAGKLYTYKELSKVALGGAIACIADTEQDTRVFHAHIPLSTIVEFYGITSLPTVTPQQLAQAFGAVYGIVNGICGQDPGTAVPGVIPGYNPAGLVAALLASDAAKRAGDKLSIGKLAPGQEAKIPNGEVELSVAGKVTIKQKDAKWELTRDPAGFLTPVGRWFNVAAEIKKKAGQVYGILAGERTSPVPLLGRP